MKKADGARIAVYMQELLHFETELRLYHWTTSSYARHKATDELYNEMRQWIDTFLEVAFGNDRGQQDRLPASWTMPVRKWTEKEAVERVAGFAAHIRDAWVLDDPGLLSLRDDLLNILNKTSYLFRLA